MLRGAPISDEERKELNLEARRLFESDGVRMVSDDYDKIRGLRQGIYMGVKDEVRELGFVGYANYYLLGCRDKSELKTNVDVAIYKQLLEIDSKLGTTQSEQLLECVFNSLRMDLIKV